MTKIPHKIRPEVAAPDTSERFVANVQNRSGEILTGALSAAVDGLKTFGATMTEERNRVARSGALQEFSKWQTRTKQEIAELREASPADDGNYYDQADATIENSVTNFINDLPANIQEEFRTRATQVAESMRLQEFAHDRKKKYNFFSQGVKQEIMAGTGRVHEDYGRLESEYEFLLEVIDTTGLDETSKENFRRQARVALEKRAYRQHYRDELTQEYVQDEGVQSFVDSLIGAESGGDPNAKNKNSTAEGLGQFIDKTWKQFLRERHPNLIGGDTRKQRRDPDLSKEAIVWYAQKNESSLRRSGLPVNQGTLYLSHFLGAGGAKQVLQAPSDSLVSTLLPKEVISANKSVLKGKTAEQVISWAYGKMNMKRADATMDSNPAYSNLSIEERLALRSDAEREVFGDLEQNLKNEEDRRSKLRDDLYTGLFDGKYGNTEIDKARELGLLENFSQIAKATSILEAKQKDREDSLYAINKLNDDSAVWTYDNTKDKKALDALFGKKQIEALQNNDPGAAASLMDLGERTRLWPPQATATLNQMATSQDWKRARFALETLANMQSIAPNAFDVQTTSREADRVELYKARRAIYPDEKLQEIMNPALGLESESARAAARSMAEKEVRKTVTPKGIAEEFNSYFQFGENPPRIPSILQESLYGEYITRYSDAYAQTADPELSKHMALSGMHKSWGHSSADRGRKVLMKFPPHKAGYRPVDGSFDWIGEKVRDAYGLAPEESFDLVSDRQTVEEVEAFRRGQLDRLPSYVVVEFDANGGMKPPQRNDDGSLKRAWFKFTEEDRAKLVDKVEMKKKRLRLRDIRGQITAAKSMQLRTGLDIPQELIDAEAALAKELGE